MLAVIVIAAVVIVAAVVRTALGRGGGLSAERGDYAPLDVGPVSATDVVLLRPPSGLWGYNMQATDEVLEQVAESIRERDVRIVALEQLVTDLSRDHAPAPLLASPYAGARHRREPVAPPGAYPGPLSGYSETPGSYSGSPGAYAGSPDPYAGTPGPYAGSPDAYAGTVGMETAEPEVGEQPPAAPAAEPARPPFEPPRPNRGISGPPERSHD